MENLLEHVRKDCDAIGDEVSQTEDTKELAVEDGLTCDIGEIGRNSGAEADAQDSTVLTSVETVLALVFCRLEIREDVLIDGLEGGDFITSEGRDDTSRSCVGVTFDFSFDIFNERVHLGDCSRADFDEIFAQRSGRSIGFI